MLNAKVHKGTFYFTSYKAARDYAEKYNWPVDRIIPYERGDAIQLYTSGPYVGPKTTYDELSTGSYNPDAYR